MQPASPFLAVHEPARPPRGGDLWELAEVCLQPTAGAIHEARAATPAEVSQAISIARVPDGYSLVTGGFYGETRTNGNTKIPLLGDMPIINFFFKSKESSKEKTSLVFVVTPKSYNPANGRSTDSASARIHSATALDCDYNWVSPDNPGPAHEPNLKRTIRSLQPTQAPYYPRADELAPRQTSPAASSQRQPKFSRAGKH